jgi:hypothetical protein
MVLKNNSNLVPNLPTGNGGIFHTAGFGHVFSVNTVHWCGTMYHSESHNVLKHDRTYWTSE